MVLRKDAIVVWIGWLIGGLLALQAQDRPEVFLHGLWDRVLQEYVDEQGQVDYGRLREHSQDLTRYVQLIGRWSPDNAPELFPTRDHRLAYWINAYNALIVHRVVRNHPVESIKDLGGLFSSVFNKKQSVGGRMLSYNDIEHDIVRKRFQEPRIHFVLNCASRSCAPLQRRALTAQNLEAVLQQAAVRFLNDPRHVRIDPARGEVKLSRYFDWFEKDFLAWLEQKKGIPDPGVLDYLKLYLSLDKRELLAQRETWDIDFLDYDWSLNQARSGG